MKKTRYKSGDVVLVKSPAGDCIPRIHVKLLKRVVVKEKKGRYIGIKKSMDWPGYSGWEAVAIYQDEIDELRKNWGIPYGKVGDDIIFVYDDCIIKKPRKPEPNIKKIARRKNKVILRKKSKKRS
tara:strand:- start:5571 stop:5945 length:375 start_codon:yes stop_codon:yes gene_type:complete